MPYPAQVTCRLCSERELVLVDASGKEFRSTKADEGETKAKNATIGQSACLERGLAVAVHVYMAASLGLLICDDAKKVHRAWSLLSETVWRVTRTAVSMALRTAVSIAEQRSVSSLTLKLNRSTSR